LLYTQNPLFLPDPGDSTKAYLFYGQYRYANLFGTGPALLDVLFTYAYLDIPTQSLISKGNVAISDTTSIGGLAAVRHANGRDWWVVKPGRFQDEYYVGLLGPQGIEFEKRILSDVEHLEQGRPCSYFSESGDIFVNATGFSFKIYRFNFDRCEGSFSNVVLHSVADSVWNGDWMAPALSGDGSKFYFRRSSFPFGTPGTYGLYQYDFDTGQIVKLSILSPSIQITPNFRQIIQGSTAFAPDTAFQTYNLIYFPDSAGVACTFQANVDTVLNAPNFIAPSAIVNFRLGKIEGSPCDTIVSSLAQVPEKEQNIHLYPNPSCGSLNINLSNGGIELKQILIYNTVGQEVYERKLSGNAVSLELGSIGINPGVYYVEIRSEDRVYRQKVIYTE